MVKKITLLFFSLILHQTAFAAVIATVDRSEIAINESFNLRYESSDKENRTPDFSPINKDFDIVGQNKETSLNITNGKRTQKTIFHLTLLPKRTGTLTIPEIQFSKSSSAHIIINVKQQIDRSSDKDINLSISSDKKQAYNQEQIIITVKLTRAINTLQESLSELEFSHEDIIVQPLSKEYKQYEAMLNGRRHIVYERQYAIFPQKAGELKLSPITYQATIPDQQQRQRSFFDDPFFNRSTGKRIIERSQALSIDIKPKPDSFIGKHWLPASKVNITETFSENLDQLKVGDSITRTITIKADQQLASTLPETDKPNIENARAYPDQSDSQQGIAQYGVYSQRIERTAIVPSKAGKLTLPAINIEWWNTRTQQKEIANIPGKTLDVAGNTAATPITEQADNSFSAQQASAGSKKWFYLAVFAFSGWILTLCAWMHITFFKGKVKIKNSPGGKEAVIKACKSQNAQASRDALLAWAKQSWPDKDINNLGALGNYINQEDFSHALNDLQKHLYGQMPHKWSSQSLITSMNNLNTVRIADKKSKHRLFNIN